MTTDRVTDAAEIRFRYDERYRRAVTQNADPDSWIDITIEVNETYIYGDEQTGVTGFAGGAVLNFLESTEAILNDEQYILEFEFGPSWLALDPRDGNSVSVGRCSTLMGAKNPEERLEIDVQRPVSQRDWIDAVLYAAWEFNDTVLELNPDLQRDTLLTQVRGRIAEVEELTASTDGEGYTDK